MTNLTNRKDETHGELVHRVAATMCDSMVAVTPSGYAYCRRCIEGIASTSTDKITITIERGYHCDNCS